MEVPYQPARSPYEKKAREIYGEPPNAGPETVPEQHREFLRIMGANPKGGDPEKAMEMLDKIEKGELNIDINQPNYHGWTALHFAAYGAKPSIVTMLLDAKADINAKADVTPIGAAMQAAISKNYGEELELLKEVATILRENGCEEPPESESGGESD